MAKGVSIKFKSYSESVSNLLKLTKFENEVKKHQVIVLKPYLKNSTSTHTPAAFTEAVLNFCLNNKNPEAQIYIAEGSDGEDTMEVFDKLGYKKLAEQYSVSLIDLNTSDVEEVKDDSFLKFESIKFPKILQNSYVISLPKLAVDNELEMIGALSNMVGAFPAKYYTGWFGKGKNKIRNDPIKYAIHDITRCKMPNTCIVDASEQGSIMLGDPIEIDKQASRLLGKDWKAIQHIKLVDESHSSMLTWLAKKEESKSQKQVAIIN